jgi:hypothetical protein
MRAALYKYLAGCFCRDPEGKLHPVKPNKTMVDHHADALRAAAHLDDAVAPAWLGEQPIDMLAEEILSFKTACCTCRANRGWSILRLISPLTRCRSTMNQTPRSRRDGWNSSMSYSRTIRNQSTRFKRFSVFA